MIIDIPQAIQNIKQGKMLIITDSEARENEGDFFIPTEKLSPNIVNFMATYGKGLVVITLPKERLTKLKIPKMSKINTSHHHTGWFMSCDSKKNNTTGISAFDRYHTMNYLINNNAKHSDFLYPGHVFPLMAHSNGVFDRNGHTEASTDLASIAGFKPSGVMVEIMDDDGQMARLPKLLQISKEKNIDIVTISSLIEYRKKINY